MSESFVGKVIGAASQGAVGAFVGATLSAVTEPVVNEVLVKRKPVLIAVSEHSMEKIVKFFSTTITTNFIKFPFFEVVNMIMNSFTVPAAVRGTVTGFVFTSATLPITNYRFKKSMNLPVGNFLDLYQAYLPTVGRDVLYGIARNKMMAWITDANPHMMATPAGRAKAMFMTVLFSCFVSAPGNEYRGFVLQPKGKEKPFFEFFQPIKTLRSTIIGGLIMSTSLASGAFSTPFVEAFVGRMREATKKDPLGAMLLVLFLLDRLFAMRSSKAVEDKAR
jgi:hypothetical protein